MNLLKVTLLFLLVPFLALAQDSLQPRLSPLAMASCRHKSTYVKITYSQPQKRSREIFGKLVPYGAVWRTGANEATEITITQEIVVNGTPLKAGTYSLFSIPQADKWIIIINDDVGLWGAYNYNAKLDVLRLEAPVQMSPDVHYEAFTISIDQRNEKADIVFRWDNVKVSFPIEMIEPKP